ncbi:hypothetical protein TIFTF001_033873 [Ficus carica]|uniref:NB-ARC domain-containing protein n=1 Tax=Ficus carica TaxID=3494 RepID=A0AA88DZI6_FICCA|nr:hypothetical protein TIFTF001_033873 [Ficus carica]
MGNCFSITCQTNAPEIVLSHCFNCISRQTRYVNELKKNLDALKTALEALEDAKNDLVRKVNVAEQEQHLKRLDKVQRWISRVESMEAEVKNLMEKSTQEVNKLCLWGCCSKNYISSYKFGKKVFQKLSEVNDLQREGVFEAVAERVPVASVVEIPLEPTVGLETQFDEVWKDLNYENVGIMGLFGMGGVGKTTLLKKINNNFLKTPNDYNVIWVVVSKDHRLENIQNVLGEKIGCSDDAWKKRNHDKKAVDVFSILSRRRFVLLLDDIWERVGLTKLGVPLPDKLNGSKIVFTTRSKDVCFRMEANKKVQVKCLTSEKSWTLFQEKVGEEALNAHPEIPSLAKIVAKKCGGLPLALNTIGRAMACKRTTQEWNYAIQVLKNSASDFSDMGREVFPLLKFSYDSLESEKVRPCFFYCALFPDDASILRDDLINLWMGEGFLGEYDDINAVKDQGYNIIGTLLYACLLEENEFDCVKMHDVIRDMALWIVSGCGKEAKDSFLVKTNAQLSELPTVERWNELSRISLMGNNIESLSGTPTCPNLLTLLLRDNSLCRISDSFFDSMNKLRVLDLLGNKSLTYLPVGISQLVSLQYLDLSSTEIKELPRELCKLVLLKYLLLNFARKLDVIQDQVISSCSRLQVLDMFYCGVSEKIVEDRVQCGGNELLILDTLAIRCCTSLEDLKVDWGWERRDQSIEPQHCMITVRSCFQKLRRVTIKHCHKLKDLTWLVFVPNLDSLVVDDCSALEEIIHTNKLGDGLDEIKHLEPFVKLDGLNLFNLPSLKNIYHKPLPCLKIIRILQCVELKKLPISSDITNAHKLIIEDINVDTEEQLLITTGHFAANNPAASSVVCRLLHASVDLLLRLGLEAILGINCNGFLKLSINR